MADTFANGEGLLSVRTKLNNTANEVNDHETRITDAQADATQALTDAATAQSTADSKVASITAGTPNVSIDNTDPQNPEISVTEPSVGTLQDAFNASDTAPDIPSIDTTGATGNFSVGAAFGNLSVTQAGSVSLLGGVNQPVSIFTGGTGSTTIGAGNELNLFGGSGNISASIPPASSGSITVDVQGAGNLNLQTTGSGNLNIFSANGQLGVGSAIRPTLVLGSPTSAIGFSGLNKGITITADEGAAPNRALVVSATETGAIFGSSVKVDAGSTVSGASFIGVELLNGMDNPNVDGVDAYDLTIRGGDLSNVAVNGNGGDLILRGGAGGATTGDNGDLIFTTRDGTQQKYPLTDGAAGTFLQTDAAGNLTWAAAGGGTVTEIQPAGGLSVTNGTGPIVTVSGAAIETAANNAQADATQALADAAAAQADATQALTDAATAQSTADSKVASITAGTPNVSIDNTDPQNPEISVTSTGGGIPSGTTPPGSPSVNDLWFNTNDGLLYFYSGATNGWLTSQLSEVTFNEQGTTPNLTWMRKGNTVTGETGVGFHFEDKVLIEGISFSRLPTTTASGNYWLYSNSPSLPSDTATVVGTYTVNTDARGYIPSSNPANLKLEPGCYISMRWNGNQTNNNIVSVKYRKVYT